MVTVTENGRCVFRLYLPHAGSVELVGTFCDWKSSREDGALELEQEDTPGWWTAKLQLGCGDHEFCYLVDGRCWMPDYAACGVRRRSSGRWVSLISVPERARPEGRPAGATAEPRIDNTRTRTPEPQRAVASV